MKKLLAKDKKLRSDIKSSEVKRFVLKAIFKNSNFFRLIRWNAFLKLKGVAKPSSTSSLTNRCVVTINKKRLNKYTVYSRQVFLKLIRSGSLTGVQKSSW